MVVVLQRAAGFVSVLQSGPKVTGDLGLGLAYTDYGVSPLKDQFGPGAIAGSG